MNKLIIAELLRNKWDSKFRVTGLGRDGSRYFKALGEIATCLLDLITSVQEMEPELLRSEHQAIWWTHLVVEAACLGRHCLKTKVIGKDSLRRLVMSENKCVRNFENPFTEPHTREFFNAALNVCERSDQIRKNALTPFIKSRSHFVNNPSITKGAYVFQCAPHGAVTPIRQGRKKQNIFDPEYPMQ